MNRHRHKQAQQNSWEEAGLGLNVNQKYESSDGQFSILLFWMAGSLDLTPSASSYLRLLVG